MYSVCVCVFEKESIVCEKSYIYIQQQQREKIFYFNDFRIWVLKRERERTGGFSFNLAGLKMQLATTKNCAVFEKNLKYYKIKSENTFWAPVYFLFL